MLSSDFINCPNANGNTTTLYIIHIQKWYAHSVLWLLYATLTGHRNGNHVQLATPTTKKCRSDCHRVQSYSCCLKIHEFVSQIRWHKIEKPNVAGQIYVFDRRKFRGQTSDNMDRWKAEMGRVREKRRVEQKRWQKRKSQKKEAADARKGGIVAKLRFSNDLRLRRVEN